MPGNFYTVTPADVAHWPPVNYKDPDHRTWLPPYSIAFMTVSTIFVWGRLFLRLQRRSGAFGLDDAFIFCGWVFAVAFTGIACISVWKYEIGRHIWDLQPQYYADALYMGWMAQVMFLWSTGFTKMSVLLFYRRMVKDAYGRGWIYTVWILMFITSGSVVGIFVAYLKICTPLNSYWNFLSYSAAGHSRPWKCLDGDAMTISTSVLTIASDFWTAALPCAMFQVHDLGISRKQKIAMNVIFCLGFFVTGVGIARTYFLWKIGHNDDLTWVGYDLFASSMLEIQLAIICTCAPFCRAFFRRFIPEPTQRSRITNTLQSESSRCKTESQGRLTGLGDCESIDYQLKPMNSADLVEEKTGVLVREAGSGMLKPVWSGRRASIRETFGQEPMEYT